MCLRAKIRIFQGASIQGSYQHFLGTFSMDRPGKSADLPEMNSLVKSFTYWYEEIRSALIYPYSNGFTEGCNNKIKVLKRVSFGLRNFERFRNRILYINTRNEKDTHCIQCMSSPGVHRHFSTPKFDKEPKSPCQQSQQGQCATTYPSGPFVCTCSMGIHWALGRKKRVHT